MKYIDEYRDRTLVSGLLAAIKNRAAKIDKNITLMEICGTHTHVIGRFGIKRLLPAHIRLVSGPGCPVCVTSIHDVDKALYLAGLKNVIFATFGDMLRVPGTNRASLQESRAGGADVRIVSSAADCIEIAESNRKKEVIMMGIGFETTAPTVASVIELCQKKGITNFSIYSVHKVVPPAVKALIEDPSLNIDGFICPGHVSTIIGTNPYTIIPEAGRAAVITGFEPVDILEGVLMILGQIGDGKKEVAIQYTRGVNPEGNSRARDIMHRIFQAGDAEWRGLGMIPASGLFPRSEYKSFDVLERFDIPDIHSEEIKGCGCGDILKGVRLPDQCPLFRKTCTPLNPIGPCMVSSEGTCAAYYKYHLDE
ncbi:MAG: hydrogenase formation protein HypD [Syntrophaceae bacterium]